MLLLMEKDLSKMATGASAKDTRGSHLGAAGSYPESPRCVCLGERKGRGNQSSLKKVNRSHNSVTQSIRTSTA